MAMRVKGESLRLVCLLLLLASLSVTGCGAGDGGGNGGGSGQTNPDVDGDFTDAKMIAEELFETLDGGASIDVTLSAKADELEQRDDVAAVILSPSGNSLWVVFTSGLQYIYETPTLEPPEWDTSDEFESDFADNDEATAKHTTAMKTASPVLRSADAAPAWRTNGDIPSNNKALVCNAIGRKDILWESSNVGTEAVFDMTPYVKKFFSNLGYAVRHVPSAGVEQFESLADYSVIFIETVGSRQGTVDLLTKLPVINNVPNAGVDGSTQVLGTRTVVTDELRTKYTDDLKYGRLKIRQQVFTQDGQKSLGQPYFGVTANFVRQHNSGVFPDVVFFCLNCNNAVGQDTATSEWYDLLAEKSKTPHFVGWSGNPKYPDMQAGFANLLELMSGARYRYVLKEGSISGSVKVTPERIKPPVNLIGLTDALATLSTGGYLQVEDTDSNAPAVMFHLYKPENISPLILAPVIHDLYISEDHQVGLYAWGPDNVNFRISHEYGSGETRADAGARGDYDVSTVFLGADYKFELHPLPSGPMRLYLPDERHGPDMTLLKWTPVFRVSGSGLRGLTYSANYRLSARALVAPRWRTGTKTLLLAWSAPVFDEIVARFEADASTVDWTVSGSYTEGDVTYSYAGSGVKTLTFKADDGELATAEFRSSPIGDGTMNTSVVVDTQVEMTYTETVVNTRTGEKTETIKTISLGQFGLADLTLASDMTLKGGTQTVNGDTATWSDTAPTPKYDPDEYRR